MLVYACLCFVCLLMHDMQHPASRHANTSYSKISEISPSLSRSLARSLDPSFISLTRSICLSACLSFKLHPDSDHLVISFQSFTCGLVSYCSNDNKRSTESCYSSTGFIIFNFPFFLFLEHMKFYLSFWFSGSSSSTCVSDVHSVRLSLSNCMISVLSL